MTVYYLDTSVALRILFHHSRAAAAWFDEVNGDSGSHIISSRLLRTEMTRALRRTGQPLERRTEVLDFVGFVPVDHAVLHEAEAIVPHLKTLDALHLASALRTGLDDLVVTTHDQAMGNVAGLLGFDVHDPVTDDVVLTPTRRAGRRVVEVDGWPVIEAVPGVTVTDADVQRWRDDGQR